MSLVRISNELIRSVENRVNVMAGRELEQHPTDNMHLKPGDPGFDEYLEVALEVLWSKAPQLRGQLPAEWLDKTQRIDMAYKRNGSSVNVHLNAGTGTRLATPPNTGTWPDVVISTHNDKLETLTEKIRQGLAIRSAIADKYTRIRVQLVDFLRAQPSLNRALIKHPEIAMYVDAEYIDRVNAKDNRAKNGTVEDKTIDVDAITTAAIAHRLATAGGAA